MKSGSKRYLTLTPASTNAPYTPNSKIWYHSNCFEQLDRKLHCEMVTHNKRQRCWRSRPEETRRKSILTAKPSKWCRESLVTSRDGSCRFGSRGGKSGRGGWERHRRSQGLLTVTDSSQQGSPEKMEVCESMLTHTGRKKIWVHNLGNQHPFWRNNFALYGLVAKDTGQRGSLKR